MVKLNAQQSALVESNFKIVPYTIKKYLYSLPFDYDDMVSIGNIALCKAAANYKPSNGKFTTFASTCIVRAIKREAKANYTKKRGEGKKVESLDTLVSTEKGTTLSFIDTFHDDTATGNVESYVLNKIYCEKLWVMLPTYIAMEKGMLFPGDYMKGGRIHRCEKTNRMRRKELEKVRRYLMMGDRAAVANSEVE